MRFKPQNYQTVEFMRAASIAAFSDTVIDGKDVFGYVNDVPYEAIEVYDDVNEMHWTIAGDPIEA